MLYKVLNLPTELEKDSLYFVLNGDGFDFYVTNHHGSVVQAYPLNRIEVVPVIRTVPSYDQETFFNIDLDTRNSFEWSIEVSREDQIHTRKIMATLNEGVLEGVEFAILGHEFNIEFDVIKEDNNCKLILHNNEPFNILSSIRLL
jgi:hypothetical protein